MPSHFISTKIELEKRDGHPKIGPKSKILKNIFFDKFSKKYFLVFLVFLDDSKIFQIFFRFFRFFFEKKIFFRFFSKNIFSNIFSDVLKMQNPESFGLWERYFGRVRLG